MTTLVLNIAAAAGLAIATFFTLVIYGKIAPDAKFIPRFCRLEPEKCMTVLGHPDARFYGIPNSLIGMLFYILVVASAVAGRGNLLRQVAVVAAWIAVTSGVYFTYSLLVKIRIPCMLCFTAHALNLLIALIMVIDEVRR